MTDHIQTTTENGVRTIRMARPEKKNALTFAMYAAMADAIAAGERDDAVRVFVITGTGDVFSAGNDLNDFLTAGDIAASPAARFLHALAETRKPVVVAVNGLAVGIGATMLLHCDLVHAVPEARLQFPFINLALVPEAASTLLLPRTVGHARAAELLMLGDPLDAATAHQWGLINRIVPSHDLAAAVADTASRLADKPAEAMMQTKALMKRPDHGIADRLAAEFAAFSQRLTSPELREAVAAFLERRPADFRSLQR